MERCSSNGLALHAGAEVTGLSFEQVWSHLLLVFAVYPLVKSESAGARNGCVGCEKVRSALGTE